jgi:type IV secretion system protein VirD4
MFFVPLQLPCRVLHLIRELKGDATIPAQPGEGLEFTYASAKRDIADKAEVHRFTRKSLQAAQLRHGYASTPGNSSTLQNGLVLLTIMCGETVRILNPAGLWQDIIGAGDCYNPLDIVVDDLERAGGLRDVPDDLREQCAQILPEPANSDGDNTYWREGSRSCISMAMILESMIEGRDATLSSVALLIQDRQALEHNLRWVVGVDLEDKPLPEGPMPIESCAWAQIHDAADLAQFIQWVRAQAKSLLSLMRTGESRTFDSFISGAQQALAPFAFGRLAPAMRRSTFSMNDLKSADKPTSLFIVADASRMEVYKSYIGLIQWCAMTAIKRHANKAVPVYFIMDEATNYKIHGLTSLLTWGRSYGLRLHLIFQDISAFENTYGRTAVETLLSETEIKQFLPGQRSPRTLALIRQLLGDQRSLDFKIRLRPCRVKNGS